MSPKQRRSMDVNSLLAYHEGKADLFEKREIKILSALRCAKDLTDREIMLALGFSDMNAVRPRITDLIEDGVVEKTGDKLDPVTGKRVRTVALCADPRKPQAEFAFEVVRAIA